MQIITAVLRAVQFIFAVVVLGLSVDLAKGQVVGNTPATTGYSAFTGGLGIIAAVVGILALFIDALDGIITWAIDALASVCFLAGGIAIAIGLRGTDCSDPTTLYKNDLLNCGSTNIKKEGTLSWCKDKNTLSQRCRQDTADAAFEFMAFIICAALLVWTFLHSGGKIGGRSSGIV